MADAPQHFIEQSLIDEPWLDSVWRTEPVAPKMQLTDGAVDTYTVRMVEFDWDESNRSHVEDRHGVTKREAEEVLEGTPVRYSFGSRNGEVRQSYVGPTASGRLLHVVTTERGGTLRIITAHPARKHMKDFLNNVEGRAYEGKEGGSNRGDSGL